MHSTSCFRNSAVRRVALLAFGLSLGAGLVNASDLSAAILTPKPGPEPKINGPVVYGVRPGHPFLYRIPCTGVRPIRFTAQGLPAALRLDPSTGIITGRAPEKAGEYPVELQATNHQGKASKRFRIVVGDSLALTPPMGWNDWYTHYDHVTDKLVRQAADAMIASGMADYGYQYVNIDDCWMVKPGSNNPELKGDPRDADGAIRPNRRFPDMAALTAYIHARGLKAGIYTGPGPRTCAGFTASYKHEAIDARTFAKWGFDFLKYDWCSYTEVAGGKALADYKRPYELMGGILPKMERDIVFNLCQYGMGDVWNWGGDVGGHAWRTTGDLGLEKDSELPGFYSIGFKNAEHAAAARPGRWNDPDYILIGSVGDALHNEEPPTPTRLVPEEQYSYVSMWALMASPLIFSGDMSYLDAFTLNVLCNSEVIEVDQDPLGQQARIVRHTDREFVLAKPMEDGSLAVGLFNIGDRPAELSVTWSELGLDGTRRVRDVWRQQDIGSVSDKITVKVNRHGVTLVRLMKE